MSDNSDIYACPVCTYEQSTDVSKCEMCDTLNPHRRRKTKSDTLTNSCEQATCPQCTFINTVNRNTVCEMCGHELTLEPMDHKRFRASDDNKYEQEDPVELDDYEDYDDDQINDFDISVFESRMPQTSEPKQKMIEAVEKPMSEQELSAYYEQYIAVLEAQRQQIKVFHDEQLHDILHKLFASLQCKKEEPTGQLMYRCCQICYDKDEPVVTMQGCGHRMICPDDFHQYLSTRIRDGDLLPWIPCPAEICNVPCDPNNIIQDGHLTYSEMLSFICQEGGFLQFGTPRKEQVTCKICSFQQTIEKGTDGDLDIAFKQMIQSGQLRECPTCRHLTMKEKGLCNVIECSKCGVWWNWQTREQGHSEKDLKQRARRNGTLWEPGELRYQQDLQRNNPKEFKALLERNGIKYNPNYVRGGWNEN